ncbi:hypothetical protein MYMA111404_00420 [Mycoplasma marinum]|uniref:Uncharacterized protein n=1 Tax=Mycoplasma marinum TaxID=1937190 RepID=A0A4R0XTF1_9MOLU|nr:hypothetical protein [Mycoplasma marinum]TCG11763.1 hypothetical protein C4B24_01265 [Mycoplasma marinum]
MIKSLKKYTYGFNGWFSLPELYIKTNDEDESWKFLSPGTSFNFGHKISSYEKPRELWQSISYFGGY